jgi:hypothetical protein
MRPILTLACALLLGACSSTPKPTEPKMPSELSPPPGSAPATRPAPDREVQEDNKPVTFEARLDIDRLAGGKRFQGTVLYLDSGQVLVAAYRPIPRYFEFVDKRVVVTGRHYMPSPDVQHVSGLHFSIESIKLAPGETPYDPKPVELPTPASVRRGDQLEPLHRRWVQLFARLDAGRLKPDDYWSDVVLKLADGVPVSATVYQTSFKNKWKPLIGREVTVIGKLAVEGPEGQRRYALQGPLSICRGKVPRCGMEPVAPQHKPGCPPAP